MAWLRRKKTCDACFGPLGDDPGTIRYRVADREDVQEMKICKECGDRLEAGSLKVEDFDA